jgi:hypothetical protein
VNERWARMLLSEADGYHLIRATPGPSIRDLPDRTTRNKSQLVVSLGIEGWEKL